MNKLQPDNSRSPIRNQGSALLMTLMVVSLLMVIVLSFVVFVRLELRQVIQRQQLLQARAHARLGMNLAISQLQESAGPDTRVTAPLQDLTARPNQRLIGHAVDAGAYRTAAGGGLERNPDYATTLGYFISTEDVAFDPLSYFPFSGSGDVATGNALLVGPGTVSTLQDEDSDGIPDGFVAAPVVNVGTGTDGAFAWWIGDEGIKAQINVMDDLDDNTSLSTAERQRARIVGAQRTGSEAILDQYDPANATQNEILNRSTTLGQLNLISGFELAPTVVTNFYHDVTLQSLGVPSNTRRGGLKRDLMAVMKEVEANSGNVNTASTQWTQLTDYQSDRIDRYREETVALTAAGELDVAPGSNRHLNALQALTLRADQANSQFSELIFPPMTDMDIIHDQGGASWENLLSWATLKQRRESGGRIQAQKRWGGSMELSPVIARVAVSATLTLDYPEVRYYMVPVVVLWNPYSVPIQMNGANVKLKYGVTSRENLWMRLRVNHPDWSAPNTSAFSHIPPANGNPRSSMWTPAICINFFNNATSSTGDKYHFQLRNSAGGTGLVIPPGQARIFTMHEHSDIAMAADGTYNPTVELLEGLPSATGQFGMYSTINIEDEMDDPTNPVNGYNLPSVNETGSSWHRDPDGGYSRWQPDSKGGGNGSNRPQALPYPFPLDPDPLGLTFTALGYTDPLDPAQVSAYQAEVEGQIIYDFSDPLDTDMCINTNYFRDWNITGMGFEFGRINNQQLDGFRSLRLVLDIDGDTDNPLVEIYYPTGEMPTILNHARLSDIDNTSTDRDGNPIDQITPEITAQATPVDSGPLPPDTIYGWGFSWGLRLPENPYQVDAAAGDITGNTASSDVAPNRWLSDFNPFAPFPGLDPSSRATNSDKDPGNYKVGGFNSPASYIGGFFMGGERYSDLAWMTPDDLNQFIGTTDDTPLGYVSGAPRAIILEVPESSDDFANPASFMHAPLTPSYHAQMPAPRDFPDTRHSGYHYGFGAVRDRIPRFLSWNSTNYAFMQPAFMIGNSRSHFLVDRARAEQSFYGTTSIPNAAAAGQVIPYCETRSPRKITNGATFFPGYDTSWIYNEVLWDDFMFTPDASSRLQWSDGLGPDDRDFTTSAENLMIKGAFNINSTSVPAWAALLYSMMEVDLGTGDDMTGFSAFSRFLEPPEAAFNPATDNPYSPEAYGGYRRLSQDDIWDNGGTPNDPSDDTGLAVEIVQQVRLRGPFLSTSDFVNRALVPESGDTDGLGLAGAIQTAIDRTDLNTSLGEPADTDVWIDSSVAYASNFERIHPGNLGSWVYDSTSSTPVLTDGGRSVEGASGQLMQADILARIGSVVQARSDTFKIRAQGIQGDPDNPNARAWCEVTVQRRPEYVDDAADAPGVLPGNLTSPANLQFGRRFEVVSFRWLAEEEI